MNFKNDIFLSSCIVRYFEASFDNSNGSDMVTNFFINESLLKTLGSVRFFFTFFFTFI